MDVERVASVIPVDDLATAVEVWARLLGVPPTFVDGDRWAQFDVAGGRIALAGADRAHDSPGLLVKVADVDRARADALAAGLYVGEVTDGPHERRCVVTAPDRCPVVFYTPTAG